MNLKIVRPNDLKTRLEKLFTRRKIIEYTLTLIIFLSLTFIQPSQLGFVSALTGNVVIGDEEDVQAEIQKVLRRDLFNDVGNGVNICLQVRDDGGEFYSYKIRKRAGIFDVHPSERYCNGKGGEDFVLTFTNYDSFLEFKEDLKMDFFTESEITDKFQLWPSRYLESGGLIICEDGFREDYCPMLKKHFSKSQRKKLGITCCDDPDEEIAGDTLFGEALYFAREFWWLLAIIIVILILGGGAILLLSSKDEDDKDINKEVFDYIKRARESGYEENSIRKALEDNGWDEEVIDAEFERIRKEDMSSLGDRFVKLL